MDWNSGIEWWNGQIVKLHLVENFYLSQGMPVIAYLCDSNKYLIWYLQPVKIYILNFTYVYFLHIISIVLYFLTGVYSTHIMIFRGYTYSHKC